MDVFDVLRWLLPVVILVGVYILRRFAIRSVHDEAKEPTLRWYAALVLVVIIIAIVSWVILLVPTPTIPL